MSASIQDLIDSTIQKVYREDDPIKASAWASVLATIVQAAAQLETMEAARGLVQASTYLQGGGILPADTDDSTERVKSKGASCTTPHPIRREIKRPAR